MSNTALSRARTTPDEDEDWRPRGLCRLLPEPFFVYDRASVKTAKWVCSRCPAITPCRAWALGADLRHGVAGGLSASERRRLVGAA